MNRRDSLKALVAAGASIVSARPGWSETTAFGIDRPGLQLYTVRGEMQKGVEATLERVARIGYREVEFAGYFGKPPAEIARILKATGLTAPATHVGRDTLGARWGQTLDEGAAVGHRYMVVPSVPAADRVSADSYKRLAEEFNRAGEAAAKRGMAFAYHNHDFEFRPLGDTDGFAVLLRECDPTLVHFELDLFWITRAGRDPVAYMTQHPGRFSLVHVKDMKADGAMTEVGAGTIPFQRIFDAAKGSIRHFFVEHDNPQSPFESITASLAALRRYTA